MKAVLLAAMALSISTAAFARPCGEYRAIAKQIEQDMDQEWELARSTDNLELAQRHYKRYNTLNTRYIILFEEFVRLCR